MLAKVYEIAYCELEERGRCGSGSYSQVYRAYWKTADKIVALKKFLHLQVTEEAEVLSQLSHRNIVKFIGLVNDPTVHGIVTEYIENGSLFDFLHGNAETSLVANGANGKEKDGVLTCANGAVKVNGVCKDDLNFSQLVSMASDIACGMNYLHFEAPIQVVHRDLKSKNVLLTSNLHCKICDFGSAQLGAATSRASLVGTYAWMAPEVLRSETITEKCDVYSFGVVVWELTTREVPYAHLTREQIFWNVAYQNEHLPVSFNCPADLAALMNACWQEQATRPSFPAIQARLAAMAGDVKLAESANTYMADREAFARENEAFRQRLLDFERTLQDRNQELALRAERLRVRENQLEQQFKIPKLEEYDIHMWRDIDVFEWLKQLPVDPAQSVGGGLTSEQLAVYASSFLENNITGEQLLSISVLDLERLGVLKVGHQKTLFERVNQLARNNRMYLHFPKLSSTVGHSLPSPLSASSADRPGRQSPLPGRHMRLTFVFGMHLTACCDARVHANDVNTASSETDNGASPSNGYMYKLYADVLEDEREPSVAAPMFLIRCVQFRYNPPKRPGVAHATAGWTRQVDRPPYVTPDWLPLPASLTNSDSLVQHDSSSAALLQANEFVLPDEHVSIRIDFVPKYVRHPFKVEHRHALTFVSANVRCTSHDLEAAARERAPPGKPRYRRKSNTQQPQVLRSSVSVPEDSAQSQTKPFQSQRKLVKNQLVPCYSQLAVTLELQPTARNSASDFADQLRREQQQGEPVSRRSSRNSPPEVTVDTVCTTTGTVFSCTSSVTSTRTSTPNNSNREQALAPTGQYPPLLHSPSMPAAVTYSSTNESSPYEKMTYARIAANRPPAPKAPPQISVVSNSRTKMNVSQQSQTKLTGTYQPATSNNSTNSTGQRSYSKHLLSKSGSTTASNVWSNRTNSNTSQVESAGGGYHISQSTGISTSHFSASSTTSASNQLHVNSPGTNRERLNLNLTNTQAASAAPLRQLSVAPPVSAETTQRTQTMLQAGHYRSALSADAVLSSTPLPSLDRVFELKVTIGASKNMITAMTQTDFTDVQIEAPIITTNSRHAIDASTQTTSQKLLDATVQRGIDSDLALQRLTDSSSTPRTQRERAQRRERGRSNIATGAWRKQQLPEPARIASILDLTDNVPASTRSDSDQSKVVTRQSLPNNLKADKSNSDMSSLNTRDSNEREKDGFLSATSTLSLEAAPGSSVYHSNTQSQDSVAVDADQRRLSSPVQALNMQLIVRPDGYNRPRQHSYNHSDMSTVTQWHNEMNASTQRTRRRRGKKTSLTSSNDTASRGSIEAGLFENPSDARPSDAAADWQKVVSRRARPRPPVIQIGGQREREHTGGSIVELGKPSFVSALFDALDSSPDSSSSMFTQASSKSQPNLHKLHLNSLQNDSPRPAATLERQAAPSVPVSPAAGNVPPGLHGTSGPFQNPGELCRQRHSSQSEKHTSVIEVHGGAQYVRQGTAQLSSRLAASPKFRH